MTIGTLLCITNPINRQDIYLECIASMLPWADEIVIVDGVSTDGSIEKIKKLNNPKIRIYTLEWPHKFSWDELPKHLNHGLAQIKSDFCIRVDVDYVFKDTWREGLWEIEAFNDKRIITAQKFSTILVDKVYQKGPTPMIINMKYGDMYFGVAEGQYTDLCVPIIKTGMRGGIPKGKMVDERDIYKSHLEFMNYDYCFKTKDFTAKEFLRFSRAHKRYFGTTNWGNTEEEALRMFIDMMKSRMNRKDGYIHNMPWPMHPSFIKSRVKSIKPEHFGHSGWGNFK